MNGYNRRELLRASGVLQCSGFGYLSASVTDVTNARLWVRNVVGSRDAAHVKLKLLRQPTSVYEHY